MRLFDNAFSPFARKVRLALDYKGLACAHIDGLARANHDALWAANPRGEVPTLVDGDAVVTHSSHILAYLDDAYPERPIFPSGAAGRAAARSLERLYDVRVDAILVTCSLWGWADRDDLPPEGLAAAGQADLDEAMAETEHVFARWGGAYAIGDAPGAADFALWPHLSAIKAIGMAIDAARFPLITAWLGRLRKEALFRDDLGRARDYLKTMTDATHERRKIAWRGDRLEWLLARGHHRWLLNEIEQGRVIWPVK